LFYATKARNVEIIKLLHGFEHLDKYATFGDPKNPDDALTYLIKDCRGLDDINLISYFLDQGWLIGQTNDKKFMRRLIDAPSAIRDK